MTKTKLTLFALSLLAVFCLAGWTTRAVTFEYKFEHNPNEKKANELGAQGWELVAIQSPAPTNISSTYVFRRAK